MDNGNNDIFDNLSSSQGGNTERVRLRVLGISYSQIRNGAYALILAQVGGPYRIPVVIGAGEAQAIALKMEGIVPPRPLTHDLFTSLGHAFGIELTEVFIYRFEDGVFYSELTFTDGERTITIDSRTSDAVAIAMRTGAPIYTTPGILTETGFELEELSDDTSGSSADDDDDDNGEVRARDEEPSPVTPTRTPKLENYTLEELRRTLQSLIDREEYEEAARVAEIIRRKEDGKI
ncbi:bifunctional nuclease family protein [uncultured Duncaniella sp.]|uniref:bifunctional nuclease family protein n=1 Tax=uncultured Duncaniella sp. TaxID=2768039 RepID=UPI0025AFD33D|nr:bifunctional nuclease domain-containing protein [uncultured Duncaniella sp.]